MRAQGSVEVDVVMIGGGPAGMSAALVLGRARKRALIIDAQRPRHAVAEGVHGFLTREGISPSELRRIGRAQLAPFAHVACIDDEVESVQVIEPVALDTRGGLSMRTRSGTHVTARALLLAVGVIDDHPPIPGYDALWGRSIHVCPFCHGWESRDQALGVLNHAEAAVHQALLLRTWARDLIVFTNGQPLSDDAAAQLTAAAIPIERAPITALEADGPQLTHVILCDGRRIPRQGLFAMPHQRPVPLVEALGLRLSRPHPMLTSEYIAVDPMQATSQPLIWAAGDCTTPFQSVLEAAANGARAAAAITAYLSASL
jgi:thioredoxin reductase